LVQTAHRNDLPELRIYISLTKVCHWIYTTVFGPAGFHLFSGLLYLVSSLSVCLFIYCAAGVCISPSMTSDMFMRFYATGRSRELRSVYLYSCLIIIHKSFVLFTQHLHVSNISNRQ